MTPRDFDMLRQSVEKLDEKVDELLKDLPSLYLDRQNYEVRHATLERRVDTLEQRVQRDAERLEERYRAAMTKGNEVIADLIDRLAKESAAVRKEISDLRIALYGLIIGSVLLPLFFVIAAHYFWP